MNCDYKDIKVLLLITVSKLLKYKAIIYLNV